MTTAPDLQETASAALRLLILLRRNYGSAAVCDALAGAQDEVEWGSIYDQPAMWEAIRQAIAKADRIEDCQTVITIQTSDGTRITWSWIAEAPPDPEFSAMVITHVERALAGALA